MSDEKPIIPLDALKIAAAVSRESREPLDNIVSATVKQMKAVQEKRKAPQGKFRVLAVDKYDGKDWVHKDYDTAVDAVREAKNLTNKAKPLASSHSIATVYLAYDDEGKYLGGDTWVNESA